VGLRLLADRLEVVNVRLAADSNDMISPPGSRLSTEDLGISAARFQAGGWIGEWYLYLLRLTWHKLPSDLAMEEMDLEILPAAGDLAEVHLDTNIFDGPPVSESMSVRQLLKKLDEDVTLLDLGTALQFQATQVHHYLAKARGEDFEVRERPHRQSVWLYSASDWQFFFGFRSGGACLSK
jgi:hypothetical protein